MIEIYIYYFERPAIIFLIDKYAPNIETQSQNLLHPKRGRGLACHQTWSFSVIGLVSKMPNDPGVISEELMAEIAASIPLGVATFLVTSKKEVKSILTQQRRFGVNSHSGVYPL